MIFITGKFLGNGGIDFLCKRDALGDFGGLRGEDARVKKRSLPAVPLSEK